MESCAPQDLVALQARLRALGDIAALNALKTRYARAADAKYTLSGQRQADAAWRHAAWEQAACFTEDGIWEGGSFGGDLFVRQAIYENFLKAPWRYAMHFYLTPELQPQGDEATGSWQLWQIGVDKDSGQTLVLHGRTHEHYRRTRDGWLISRMRFESLHSLCAGTHADALRCLIPPTSTAPLNQARPS